tara:strand:- start:384 stop:869 length:486 start_codon:yes stop_codon:yes gene_type:complete
MISSFNIGFGFIEIKCPNAITVKISKPDRVLNSDSQVLFSNHATDTQYSFNESLLKNVDKPSSMYIIDVTCSGVSVTNEYYEYFIGKYIHDQESMIDGSMQVRDCYVARVIDNLNQHSDEFTASIRVRIEDAFKSKLNLDDDQYNEIKEHFEHLQSLPNVD